MLDGTLAPRHSERLRYAKIEEEKYMLCIRMFQNKAQRALEST